MHLCRPFERPWLTVHWYFSMNKACSMYFNVREWLSSNHKETPTNFYSLIWGTKECTRACIIQSALLRQSLFCVALDIEANQQSASDLKRKLSLALSPLRRPETNLRCIGMKLDRSHHLDVVEVSVHPHVCSLLFQEWKSIIDELMESLPKEHTPLRSKRETKNYTPNQTIASESRE